MNRLDGKVALISGAARGIGAETARLMVKAGAWVAVGDVLDERGRETVRDRARTRGCRRRGALRPSRRHPQEDGPRRWRP